jgi:glutathione S-transferase
VYWYSVSSGAQLKVPCVASTEPHLPSFSGVNCFQYVAKSERMAPLVEMLPTNLAFVEVDPSPLDPESNAEPESDSDPELEAEPELDAEPELELEEPEGEGPDPELEFDPEPEDELPVDPIDPELDGVMVDASCSGLEPLEFPAPPSSSLDGFALDDPQAATIDRAAIGKRWRERATRFINTAVAAGRSTRHGDWALQAGRKVNRFASTLPARMKDLILHHYDGSPFSEKIRLILGFKGLGWKSVRVPVMLPKPDVVALTGGYRRTPFLQVGGDIYCDTALMGRVIDGVAPNPPLYPASAGAQQHMLAQWADSALFWTAIPYTMQPAAAAHLFGGMPPEFLKEFRADRALMTAGMRRPTPADARAQLASYFAWLEGMLAGSGAFLLGAQPCIADFAVAHSLWYIRRAPPVATVLDPFPRLRGWSERVAAFGHGMFEQLSSSEALAVAARASAYAPVHVEAGQGFEAGMPVTVAATDYATDLVSGTLVGLTNDEVAVERRDPRAGTVHVHFPRIGYQIKKTET